MTTAEKQYWKDRQLQQMLGAAQSDPMMRVPNDALSNNAPGMGNIDHMAALQQQSMPSGFCEVCDGPVFEWTARLCNEHKLPVPSFRLL